MPRTQANITSLTPWMLAEPEKFLSSKQIDQQRKHLLPLENYSACRYQATAFGILNIAGIHSPCGNMEIFEKVPLICSPVSLLRTP